MADSNAPGDGMCQETTGFLFSHQCDRFAVQACVRCGKWVCNDHNHEGADGAVCTTCAKLEPQQPPPDDPAAEPQTPGGAATAPQSRVAPSRSTGYYRDDPYFYGSYWYPGYGYHGYGYHRSYADTTHNDPSTPARDPGTASGSGHDPHDFTEGDAESLKQEGDEPFEAEMGES